MVQIIPKPQARTPLWADILFAFSVAVLIASPIAFAVLQNLKASSQAALSEVEQKLSETGTLEERKLETSVIDTKLRIEDFSRLLSERKIGLELFSLLESAVHQKNVFTFLSLELEHQKVKLSGTSADFRSLEEQILIFKKQEAIQEFALTQISLEKEGGVGYSVEFSLKPDFFLSPKQ